MEPRNQTLSNVHKNQLFEIIQKKGLNPTAFDWIEEHVKRPADQEDIISNLIYRDSPYFFKFDISLKYVSCERCPGRRRPTDINRHENWGDVIEDFTEWANNLAVEIDTPDLWAEAQKYASIFTILPEDNRLDIPFSHLEAEKIASALKEIEKRIIEEFEPTQDHLEFIQSKLSYLESKAKQGSSRIDWVNILMGVIISVALQLAWSPEKAHKLFLYFKEALAPIARLLG